MVNPAHKPLLALFLLLALSGCVQPQRDSLFIPPCDEAAPSRLELYAGTERIDATLNLMLERGWENIEARANRKVAVADCPAGMAPPVLTAAEVERQQAEMRQLHKDAFLGAFTMVPLAIGILSLRVWGALTGALVGGIVGLVLGSDELVYWFCLPTAVISGLILGLRMFAQGEVEPEVPTKNRKRSD